MAIITRFGGSGGGTPIVDPYPHVWECTVVQSGTTGVVSGVVTLEAYDILHYTMPLGFSTYDLMIGGVVYTTSFRNEGEMYIQWAGSDFVVVSANAACALPHVWVNPTYTITGSVLEITNGVDDLHTNDVIELTLSSGESASVIEYNSNTYTIDVGISAGVNYVKFNGTSFENGLFNFIGNATASDVSSGKTFYSNSGTLLTGNASVGGNLLNDIVSNGVLNFNSNVSPMTLTIPNVQLNKVLYNINCGGKTITNITSSQNGDDVDITLTFSGSGSSTQIIWAELDTFEVETRAVATYSTYGSSIYTDRMAYNQNPPFERITMNNRVGTNNEYLNFSMQYPTYERLELNQGTTSSSNLCLHTEIKRAL